MYRWSHEDGGGTEGNEVSFTGKVRVHTSDLILSNPLLQYSTKQYNFLPGSLSSGSTRPMPAGPHRVGPIS